MNAAVANAVFHATGVRARHIPIRLEELISGRMLNWDLFFLLSSVAYLAHAGLHSGRAWAWVVMNGRS
jgi:hypothetical protein